MFQAQRGRGGCVPRAVDVRAAPSRPQRQLRVEVHHQRAGEGQEVHAGRQGGHMSVSRLSVHKNRHTIFSNISNSYGYIFIKIVIFFKN